MTRTLGLAAAAALLLGPALAQQKFFTGGERVDFGTPRGSNDRTLTMNLSETEAIFASDRSGGRGSYDLWRATRPRWGDKWKVLGPLQALNSTRDDLAPTMSGDGRELYFMSRRTGRDRIYVSRRLDARAPWGTPQQLPVPGPGAAHFQDPMLTQDGSRLFYASTESGAGDIYFLSRVRVGNRWGPWGKKTAFAPANHPRASDRSPMPDENGLIVWFASNRPGSKQHDIYMTFRDVRRNAWSRVRRVPSLSTDGPDAYPFAPAMSAITYATAQAGFGDWILKCVCENGGGTGAPDVPPRDLEGDTYALSNRPVDFRPRSELRLGTTSSLSFYDWEKTGPITAWLVSLGTHLPAPVAIQDIEGLLHILPVAALVLPASGRPDLLPIAVPGDPRLVGTDLWVQAFGIGAKRRILLPVRKLTIR